MHTVPKFYSVVVDGDHELTPLKISYTGEMNGGILTLQIHQIYINDKGNKDSPDTQAVLALPKNKNQCITGIDCLLNDQKIDLKIEETEKAEEIAKEGNEQGRTTFRSISTPDEQYLNIHLGSISFESKFDITIHMEIISTNSNSKTYQTVIPFSSESISPSDSDNFTFSILFNEVTPIDDIEIQSSNDSCDYEYTFDGSILTIDKKPSKPIVLLTKLSEDIESHIQNDLHDEYSIISVMPHFLNETVNSDFIFIIDCSGSMSGSPIRNASECLNIFLHSLPVGCRFNIIMFGNDYRSVFDGWSLVEYNEDNLERAERAVKGMKANMGGTNLLGPLQHAYDQIETVKKKGRICQIFLLTDGEIHDTETVFKLVNKSRSKSRIFSIGIGNDADRNLVSGLANISFGKFDFVSSSSEITQKVVNLLSLYLAPALTNVSIHAASSENENDTDSLEIVPNPMTPIYDGNLMTIYVKRNSKLKLIENVLITGNIGEEEAEIMIDQVVNCCNLSAKKLFAFNAINDYEKLYDDLVENRYKSANSANDNKIDKLRDQIVEISIENGILSKFTSYVGVENKPHERKTHPEEISDALITAPPQMNSSRFGPPQMSFWRPLNKAPQMAPNRRMEKTERTAKHYKAATRSSPMAFGRRMESEKSSSHREKEEENRFYYSAPKRDSNTLHSNNAPPRVQRATYKPLKVDETFNSHKQVSSNGPPPLLLNSSPQMSFDSQQQVLNNAPSQMASSNVSSPPPAQFNSYQHMSFDSQQPVLDNDPFHMSYNNANMSSNSPSHDPFDSPPLVKHSKGSANHFAAAPRAYNAASNIASIFDDDDRFSTRNSKQTAANIIEKTLSGVVSSQDFDGKWKSSHFDHLVEHLAGSGDMEKIRKTLDDFFTSLSIQNENEGDIKSTIVALCILHKLYSDDVSKWKLIELKAVRWLNSKLKKQWNNEIQNLVVKV